MIWSSLARNRSLSPVVARCLGRIATLRCAANHGWTPRRIAKNEIARFRHLMTSHLAIPNPLPVPKPIPDQLPTSSSRATNLIQVTDAGGLMAYQPNFDDIYKHAAIYVDRILKGAKPSDLPIQQPTEFT